MEDGMNIELSHKGMRILRKVLIGRNFRIFLRKAEFCMTIRMVTYHHSFHYIVRYECRGVTPHIEALLIEKVKKFLREYFDIYCTYFDII
jgi:hypothetical protein